MGKQNEEDIYTRMTREQPLAPWYLSTWFLVFAGLVGLGLLAWFFVL